MTTSEATKKLEEKLSEKPKTFKEAEAVSLTDQEKSDLSRDMILGWYRAKRYEKLKALLDSSSSEKGEMKENVLKKTTHELEKLNKDLTLDERKKIAEKFSDELFNADNPEDFEKVIAKLNKEATEEQMFFVYLGTYGSLRGVKQLKKLKEKKEIAAAFKRKPGLEKKFDEAAETGDFGKVREVLTEEMPELKKLDKKDVDLMLILYSESQGPFAETLAKVPGIGQWLKQGLDWMKRTGELINYKFFQKAAKKINVDTVNLMNISHITLFELQHRNEVFQKYRHLLVSIKDRTKDPKAQKKLERDLKYIDDVNKVYESVNDAMNDPQSYNLIRAGLKKRLDKEKKLTEADKEKILAEFEGYTVASQGEEGGKNLKAKFMSLRIHTFLPLVVYGPKGERDNESLLYWIMMGSWRYKRIKSGLRFFGSDFSYQKAVAHSGISRIAKWEVHNFKQTIKGVKGLDGFTSAIEDLEKKISGHSFSTGADLKSSDFIRDMKHHDTMLRQYYALSTNMSHWLTEQGRGIVAVEKELKSLKIFEGNAEGIKSLSKETKEFLGFRGLSTVNPTVINQAYFSKLEQLHALRDASQNRFALLSRNICENVISPFEQNWMQKLKQDDLMKAVKQGQQELKSYIKPSSRMASYAKLLALPAIAVGIPVFDAIRGKAKARDIKWDIFDAGIGFVPIAGTINDFKIAFSGHTTSGRKLKFGEQAMAFGFGVLGAVSDVAWVFGGLGGVMRGGIGALRAGKAVAKAGKLGKTAEGVMEAEKASRVQKAWAWIAGKKAERAISKAEKEQGLIPGSYRALHEEEKAVKLALENARTTGNAADITAQEAKLSELSGKLAPFLQAEAKFAVAGEKFAQTGLVLNTIWKYSVYATAGGIGYFALTGVNPMAQKTRDKALSAAVYGAEKGYDITAWTFDKATSVQYGPPEFEDIVNQYVKDRKKEANFNNLLEEIEKSSEPEKKEKIEELCADNWFNSHVQSWVYQNQDKLDIKKIIEKAKKKMGGSMEDFHEKAAGGMPGSGAAAREITKGDAVHGKKSGESL